MNKLLPAPLPGDFAIWLFIFIELFTFGILFLAYAFARTYHVTLFNMGQTHLIREYGAINTIVLITSSYFVVRAVNAIKANLIQITIRWLWLALTMGLIFIIVKLVEYQEKLAEGYSLSTDLFFMFYFFLTFFHFMHVILGMVILSAVLWKTRLHYYSIDNYIGIETGASYWHMVDLVWIILFPLVYVIH